MILSLRLGIESSNHDPGDLDATERFKQVDMLSSKQHMIWRCNIVMTRGLMSATPAVIWIHCHKKRYQWVTRRGSPSSRRFCVVQFTKVKCTVHSLCFNRLNIWSTRCHHCHCHPLTAVVRIFTKHPPPSLNWEPSQVQPASPSLDLQPRTGLRIIERLERLRMVRILK